MGLPRVVPVVDTGPGNSGYLVDLGDGPALAPSRDLRDLDAVAYRRGLTVVAVAETHLHADFVSSSTRLPAATRSTRPRVHRSSRRPGPRRTTSIPACVLDVRQAGEWEAGHLPRARHVELGALPTADPPDGPVTVMCAHGERATTAASVLERHGHLDVAVMRGGPEDWARFTGGRLETSR